MMRKKKKKGKNANVISAAYMNEISQHVLYTHKTKFIMAEPSIDIFVDKALQNQRFLLKKAKTI